MTFINNNLLIYFRESFHDNFTTTLCLIVIFVGVAYRDLKEEWYELQFFLILIKAKDERTNERMNERTDGRMDGRIGACVQRWMDACMHGWMKEFKKDGKMKESGDE